MKTVMSHIWVCLCLIGYAIAAEKADFVGEWDVVGVLPTEDGVAAKTIERRAYLADGTLKSDGLFIMYLEEEKHRMVTAAGPDERKWELKDGKLHEQTTKMEFSFFISNIEGITKKSFDDEIPEILEEVSTYKIISVEKNRIELEDGEDGEKVVMTRRPEEQDQAKGAKDDPAARKEVREDSKGEQVRRISKMILDFEGFKFAQWLPTAGRRAEVAGKLRPTAEIRKRLLCNFAVVSWVAFPEENLPSAQLKAFIDKEGLVPLMTKEEKKIYATKRAEAQEKHVDQIGWKMETMWALAWVLGYENSIDVDQAQIGEETIQDLFAFVSGLVRGEKANVRSLTEVVHMEDLFYCTHNAVRSAQTGKKECVPEGFHPVLHGGIIHEKRHALTWVLSPKVSWDKTDLST